MPHIIVKMHSGRSDADKARLADELSKALKSVLNSPDAAISVGIEDVDPKDWAEKVYRPDIQGKPATIYRKPGYPPPV
ncbi:MAG TPA: tautomerase family protein [Pseudolabrys sp.]|nr:tautomerase family protein [Pseudolabrys sp.]